MPQRSKRSRRSANPGDPPGWLKRLSEAYKKYQSGTYGGWPDPDAAFMALMEFIPNKPRDPNYRAQPWKPPAYTPAPSKPAARKPIRYPAWLRNILIDLDYQTTKWGWEATFDTPYTRTREDTARKYAGYSPAVLAKLEKRRRNNLRKQRLQQAYNQPQYASNQAYNEPQYTSNQAPPPRTAPPTGYIPSQQWIYKPTRIRSSTPNPYHGKVPAHLKKGPTWEKEHNRYVMMRRAAQQKKKTG